MVSEERGFGLGAGLTAPLEVLEASCSISCDVFHPAKAGSMVTVGKGKSPGTTGWSLACTGVEGTLQAHVVLRMDRVFRAGESWE